MLRRSLRFALPCALVAVSFLSAGCSESKDSAPADAPKVDEKATGETVAGIEETVSEKVEEVVGTQLEDVTNEAEKKVADKLGEMTAKLDDVTNEAEKKVDEKAPPVAKKPTAEKPVAKSAPGAAAPDFTLPDPDGKQHKLSDYKGKFVVLEWINHGCPYVKRHYTEGHIQALQKQYTEKDVVWLSICSSAEGKQGYRDAEGWKKLAAKKGGHASAILMDPSGTVGRLYDARTTPHVFVIGPDGALLYKGAIDDSPRGPAAEATNYVGAVLDAAMAGKPAPYEKTKPYG